MTKPVENPCDFCGGSGICPMCFGDGEDDDGPCTICDESGECPHCDGTGEAGTKGAE